MSASEDELRTSQQAAQSSANNHTLLVRLGDELAALSRSVGQFIDVQRAENNRLHERIDEVNALTVKRSEETNANLNKSIESIKDTLNARGRVTSGFVFALTATIISCFTVFGGLANAYINIRLGNLTPLIEGTQHAITDNTMRERELEKQFVQMEIETSTRIAENKKDLFWLGKRDDETKERLRLLEERAYQLHAAK